MGRQLPRPFLLSISLISACSLAYEVLLMRLFSIIQWHHFSYMIISLALLGYGISGMVLALNRERLSRHFHVVILSCVALFSLSIPACFLLVKYIPFNPAEILWDPAQLGYLFSIYMGLTLPFFFAASIIGLSFYYFKQQLSSIYAADLLGAGAGSMGIIVLLYVFFPEKILIVLVLILLFTGFILTRFCFDKQAINTKLWNSVFSVIAVVTWVLLPAIDELNISPYKSQSQLLTIPATEIIAQQSSPLGLVTVVKSHKTPLRHAPGLSIQADSLIPDQLAVFIDADHLSAISQVKTDINELGYLDQTTSALPYHLKSLEDVLILGAGTGSDVLQALLNKVSHIDAVEQNPQIIALIKERYADFAGHLYSMPEVTLFENEIRAYISSSDKQYDLIILSLMDAFGRSAAGLHSMTENYLYTEQAIQQYLQQVRADGYFSVTRWAKLPPRDMPKLMATVIKVMQQNGIAEPGRQMMVIRNWQTSTLLVKKGMITAQEIERLKQFSKQHRFDLAYYPGIVEHEANQFHLMKDAYLYHAALALLSAESEAYLTDYKFNINPSTDDKPYFYQFLKWKTLPEIISLMDSGGLFLLESGYLLLIATLLQAILASVVLIVIPLWLWQKKQLNTKRLKTQRSGVSYFFCLGLAFLFIEIAFIQRFVLILHHPIFAITTVLSTFLIAAGLGSQFSQRWADKSLNRISVLGPIVGITSMCMVSIFWFEWLSHFLLQQAIVFRYIGSVLLVLPLGFFMGMPFPLGLMQLSRTMPEMIPWAWGINGCASVISAILATIIAIEFGFTGLIISAVLLYCLAVMRFPNSVTQETE